MKKLLFIFLLCIFTQAKFSTVHAQTCNPPVSPLIVIDYYLNYTNVNWGEPQGCDVLYYELEYFYSPFTPGTGQGVLVSPIYFPFYELPDTFIEYVWVRSVCDCEGGGGPGEGDGIADAFSEWVMADVHIVQYLPPPDDGQDCNWTPDEPVMSAADCGDDGTPLYFWAYYQWDYIYDIPCANEEDYIIWRHFVAPPGGVVEVSMYSYDDPWYGYGYWNDFGFAIYESCTAGFITCNESFTDTDVTTVSGLEPGTTYYIASWNNNFPYYFDYYGYDYSVVNDLNICLPEPCNDNIPPQLIDVPADLELACNDIPEPADVTATDNNGNVILVFDEESVTENCTITVTRTWTATDDCGNETMAVQIILVEDNEAPIATFVPFDIVIPCNSEIPDETPIFEDNCTNDLTVEVEIEIFNFTCSQTYIKTWTAFDACDNWISVSQVIELVSETPPSFNITSSEMTISCDDSIPPPPLVSVIDACTEATLSYDEETNSAGCLTTIVRTWTAVDECENFASVSQTIFQTDDEAPEFECTEDTLIIIPFGESYVLMPNLFADVLVNDNCDPNPVASQSTSAGTELGVGEYTVQMVATDLCENTSGCTLSITVEQSVGVSEVISDAFSLFPNPARESVFIQFSNEIEIPEKIELRDLQGRLILEETVNSSLQEVLLPRVESGTYFLFLFDENNSILGSDKLLVY